MVLHFNAFHYIGDRSWVATMSTKIALSAAKPLNVTMNTLICGGFTYGPWLNCTCWDNIIHTTEPNLLRKQVVAG